MNPIHVLNGDCLAEQLNLSRLNNDFIVCRECLVDGNVLAQSMEEFWRIRSEFISETFNITNKGYFNNTISEFEKLNHLPKHSEICLWFENDLFCQVNMWFVISLIENKSTYKIFRIFPVLDNKEVAWKGFGLVDANKLEQAFNSKVLFSGKDLALGKNLWEAYRQNDFEKLKKISKTPSDCFQFLEEVCQAHIDRFPLNNKPGRPDRVVHEIIHSGTTEFQDVFSEFSSRAGVYGFSDLQVKKIYNYQQHNL